ncbi:methyl-CpG-binding domain-containing protein 10 [Gossypium hirsutum]|uniref:Methyl-CpG-binding domain-containing protein 10 n=1 Tax=Gossypium hirsutum TaxID=3635 RepID=A0ABM3AFP5_GOSHI|nr:methyl-CpG-binding domain-containing protein 10-like [Gossypium hirsutum]
MALSEFYWGTGETPRRSARISEKAAASKDNKESETASGGIEETKDIHMEEAEKSEKMNVEGENKDETEDANSKTEPTSQEVQHAEDANISTDIKERKENVKAVSEKSQDGAQAGASGFSPMEEERTKKNEVGGEEKSKQERSTSEPEGVIKEKQSSNCNEGQNYSVGKEISKKTEAAIQNGSNADSQTGLLIKQDPGQLTSMIASQICGAFEIEKSY